jgi:hypothetical protein
VLDGWAERWEQQQRDRRVQSLLPHDRMVERARVWERMQRDFEQKIRDTVAALVEESLSYSPTFENGTVFNEMRTALTSLHVLVFPHGITASRRLRRKVKPGLRKRVYARDGYRCQTCGWTAPPDRQEPVPGRRHLTIDHVIPEALGGDTRFENLKTICTVCNAEKGRQLPAEDAA